jgi:5S rRNA maturation endonuclease (ribonuclease M5)
LTGQVLDFNQAKQQGEASQRVTVDADDIRQRLSDDVRSFVQWLYSGRALVTKTEARIGNVFGEPGASLSICLQGKDAGLWHDHATEQGGDLIALYRACMGYTGNSNFILSLKEIAKEYFNDPVEVEKSQWQPSAMERIEQKKAKLGDKPRADMLELGAPVATYRYYDTRGNVTASVVRYEPDGTRESKTFRPYCYRKVDGATKWIQGTPDLRPLYRIPEISLASTIVLTEGEGKADALAKIGIESTSAMQGANAPIEKTDWSPLYGKTVIVWPDNDDPGKKYAAAVSKHLTALGVAVKLITPPESKPAKWDAFDCVAEGDDPTVIINSAASLPAQPKPRIKLLKVSELENLAPPSWLIGDVITEFGLSMIWGRSGSLKSFIALDMAMCIATGQEWHGKAVKAGRVIYLAAEGSHGLAGRAIGWRKTRGRDLPEPNFELIPHGLTLVKEDDMTALIEALTADHRPISFVVVDTMSRTFGGGNPNQPADMNLYVTAADRLREATNSHVMVVHHGGKDTDKNELGNEGLRNASDTVIHVRRKQELVELINEAPKGKQKDAEEFKPITLRPVKVAFEQAGVEKQTLILNLEETTQDDEEVQRDSSPRLGKVEKAVMKALADANGSPLAMTRLTLMTRSSKGTLYTTTKNMEDKNLIRKIRSPDDTRDEWVLV